jgi:hypothetical protein
MQRWRTCGARARAGWRRGDERFLEGLLEEVSGGAEEGIVRCEFVEDFAKPYPLASAAQLPPRLTGDAFARPSSGVAGAGHDSCGRCMAWKVEQFGGGP